MSWFERLKSGLSKSSAKITQGIGDIFTRRKLDDAMLEELEELLIASDMGVQTSAMLVEKLRKERFDKEISAEEVRKVLATDIAALLAPVAVPVDVDTSHKPFVVLVVGVNGNGKTTTIGKMAKFLMDSGWSVLLAAGDTFRAAAVEQLKVWGGRVGCEVISGVEKGDPASVAYQAIEHARASGADIVLVDTGGRLQNDKNLMAELEKITRVIKKLDDSAPHAVVQILDATTGQNAHSQVKAFRDKAGVTGLVVTKLDGTAKGGVVVALAREFGLPIHAIGVGEGIDDLKPFDASDFANSLMGL
ncbi:MAG: signal recognition particle-docking protein FtsY [Alphaproteobacteria bacterium]|nr:signal recognition particle-docking protein FtsY [Alphaproteobacteria bacterium]